MADYETGISALQQALGARARRVRLLRNLTQVDLAKNAGIGVKALRQFEASGKGTLESALRVAIALGVDDAFDRLFEVPRFNTLAEAEAQSVAVTRRRARRRA